MNDNKEQEKERTYTQRLPESLWKKAAYHKIETGESMNALVVRLLQDFFNKRKEM